MKGSEAVDYPVVLYPCRVVPIVDINDQGFRHYKKGEMKLVQKSAKPVRARVVLSQINDSKWYRVEEIQALCQVSRKTVYRWIGLCLRTREHGVVYLKARKCFASRRWFVLGVWMREFLCGRWTV